jgi:hypothetical protein
MSGTASLRNGWLDEIRDRITVVVGASLLLAALATVVTRVKHVIDFFFGPVGGRLLSISGIVSLPSALCIFGALLLVMVNGGGRFLTLVRAVAAATGLILAGLTVVGFLGVVELATAEHGHSPFLKASDAASQAVGYVTNLAVAAAFLVLASLSYRERA